MIKRFGFFLAFIICYSTLYSQGALNASVRVSTPQLQRNDRKVFDQLEVTIKEFLNNSKWTNDVFLQEERIKCNFILTISQELDGNQFEAELAVQATRPVFGSGYETPLISYLDKDISFTYEQNQPIEFLRDNPENQNLSSILAFYVNIIMGLDYDSFSQYGGENYLLNAEKIVNNVQNSSSNSASGWRPSDGGKNRNRYWIMENLLNPRVRPFRNAMYNYHRKGLDLFTTNQDQAKAAILLALEDIDKVSAAYFNSMIIQMFTYTKKDELIEMWKIAPKAQKERVVQILSKIDPANTQRYHEIGS
jgi:Domain of unknown function (DUF4835)